MNKNLLIGLCIVMVLLSGCIPETPRGDEERYNIR